MKRIIFFLILAFSLSYADKVYELNVANMNCGGCANKIKQAASQVTQIKDFQADFTTKDLNLTVPDNADINLIILAIKLIK